MKINLDPLLLIPKNEGQNSLEDFEDLPDHRQIFYGDEYAELDDKKIEIDSEKHQNYLKLLRSSLASAEDEETKAMLETLLAEALEK